MFSHSNVQVRNDGDDVVVDHGSINTDVSGQTSDSKSSKLNVTLSVDSGVVMKNNAFSAAAVDDVSSTLTTNSYHSHSNIPPSTWERVSLDDSSSSSSSSDSSSPTAFSSFSTLDPAINSDIISTTSTVEIGSSSYDYYHQNGYQHLGSDDHRQLSPSPSPSAKSWEKTSLTSDDYLAEVEIRSETHSKGSPEVDRESSGATSPAYTKTTEGSG